MKAKIPPVLWYIGGGVLFLLLIYLFVVYVLSYFLPFIFAVILAALIEPIVSRLQEKIKIPRSLAVAICLFVIIGILVILIFSGSSRLFLEMDRLVRALPEFQDALGQIEALLDNDRLDELLENWELSPQLQDVLEDGIEEVYQTVEAGLKGIFGALQEGGRRLINFFTVLFLSFLATYFISNDKDYLEKSLFNLVPEKWKEEAWNLKGELSRSVIGYIRALFILISVTTILTIIGLEIFGVNYALVIGIISGILDLIPILGPGLIFVPWIGINLLLGDLVLALQLIILYGTMAVTRSILEPRVIGKNIGVHPVATLFGLYVGLRVFGASGVIIGPAIIIFIKAIVRAGIITKWRLEKG